MYLVQILGHWCKLPELVTLDQVLLRAVNGGIS